MSSVDSPGSNIKKKSRSLSRTALTAFKRQSLRFGRRCTEVKTWINLYICHRRPCNPQTTLCVAKQIFFFYEINKRRQICVNIYLFYLPFDWPLFLQTDTDSKTKGLRMNDKAPPNKCTWKCLSSADTSKKMAHLSSLIITQAKKVDYKQPVEKLFFALIT